MRRVFAILLFLAAVSLIAGCRTAQIREMQSEDMAMVYGHLKSDPALSDVYFFSRDKVSVGRSKYRPKIYPDGTYVIENVKPGRYFIAAFVTGGRNFLSFKYDTEAAMDKATIEVKPGSMIYLGSHQINNEQYSIWRKSGTFKLEQVKSPGEKEILQQVLSQAAGTKWEVRIQTRLKQLK